MVKVRISTSPPLVLAAIGLALCIGYGVIVLASNGGTGSDPADSADASPAASNSNATVVKAGESLRLNIEHDRPIGLSFIMARWNGERWEDTFQLVASVTQEGATRWYPAEDRAPTADLALATRNGIYVPVPDEVKVGSYRICPEGDPDNCAFVNVQE